MEQTRKGQASERGRIIGVVLALVGLISFISDLIGLLDYLKALSPFLEKHRETLETIAITVGIVFLSLGTAVFLGVWQAVFEAANQFVEKFFEKLMERKPSAKRLSVEKATTAKELIRKTAVRADSPKLRPLRKDRVPTLTTLLRQKIEREAVAEQERQQKDKILEDKKFAQDLKWLYEWAGGDYGEFPYPAPIDDKRAKIRVRSLQKDELLSEMVDMESRVTIRDEVADLIALTSELGIEEGKAEMRRSVRLKNIPF